MQVDVKKHTTKVYHLDICGVNGSWVWNFGTFSLIGNSEFPTRKPENMSTYSAVVNGINIEHIESKEPHKTVELDLYLGDYVIYSPTTFSNASHFVDENYTLYKIVEREVYDDNEHHLVLQRETHQVSDMEVYNKSEIENWTPVMAIK